MKPRRKSKTLWFSFALVVFGALYANLSYIQPLLDPRSYGYLIVGVGVVVAILRFLTDKPLD